jgi:Resolvase, N terminal domain
VRDECEVPTGFDGAGFKSLRDTCADTTTPHGGLMPTVPAGLAEFERELIRSRASETALTNNPNNTVRDNYGTAPNVNPYTGTVETRRYR